MPLRSRSCSLAKGTRLQRLPDGSRRLRRLRKIYDIPQKSANRHEVLAPPTRARY